LQDESNVLKEQNQNLLIKNDQLNKQLKDFRNMKTINKTPDISFDHDLSHLGINNSILDYSVLN